MLLIHRFIFSLGRPSYSSIHPKGGGNYKEGGRHPKERRKPSQCGKETHLNRGRTLIRTCRRLYTQSLTLVWYLLYPGELELGQIGVKNQFI